MRVIISIHLLLLFFAGNSFAQNHSYRQYTTDDGLPTNYVGGIEDDEGFIWAYTENGISKFDGTRFHNLTHSTGHF